MAGMPTPEQQQRQIDELTEAVNILGGHVANLIEYLVARVPASGPVPAIVGNSVKIHRHPPAASSQTALPAAGARRASPEPAVFDSAGANIDDDRVMSALMKQVQEIFASAK